MKRGWFNSRLLAGILLTLFFAVALYLRVALPYDKVFVGDWTKFTGVDAYYFMRLVDNLVHNFPHLTSFDPYLLYPAGWHIGPQVFWPQLISTVAWLFGLGSPSQHTIDIVGVYFPAVLGALTTIPVYFIGKALFNRWAGVIAAGLVGIFPGEFLGRSILGFTDYHVAEVFFTSVTMLFLILAVKAGMDKQLTLANLRQGQWSNIVKPFIYSLLAGIFLGIYFLTWAGALLFVFIMFVYFVIQFIIDHLNRRSTEYLGFVSTIVFITAILLTLLMSPNRTAIASFAIAIATPIVFTLISYLMSHRNVKPIAYPAVVIGLGLVSLLVLRIASPSLWEALISSLYIFIWPIGTTNLEMQPLLYPGGSFHIYIAYGNFTTGFYFSFVALGILIYLIIKRGETEKTAFVVWSLIILVAMLAMRRFAYYFVVNAALLTGYVSWLLLDVSGLNKLTTKPAEATVENYKKAKLNKRQKSGSSGNVVLISLAGILVFLAAFLPNIGRAIDTAKQATFAPSDAWYESLTWLQTNTPEPFDNSDFYNDVSIPPGTSYHNPEAAYGVTAWWDYGYWITRIGHRIPTSNPGTANLGEASIFTAQDETAATKGLDQFGSKYVIIDHDVARVFGGKFSAVATLSGTEPNNFFDVYYQVNKNRLDPVLLYYPEYYRSLAIRLYNFDGRPVNPRSSMVISYQDKVFSDGQPYKQITENKSFNSYPEAQQYIRSQKSSNYRIVSKDPYLSPIPLQAVEHFNLVYSSKGSVMEAGLGMVPEIKIFEYIK